MSEHKPGPSVPNLVKLYDALEAHERTGDIMAKLDEPTTAELDATYTAYRRVRSALNICRSQGDENKRIEYGQLAVGLSVEAMPYDKWLPARVARVPEPDNAACYVRLLPEGGGSEFLCQIDHIRLKKDGGGAC